jgi:hypothetical protein
MIFSESKDDARGREEASLGAAGGALLRGGKIYFAAGLAFRPLLSFPG